MDGKAAVLLSCALLLLSGCGARRDQRIVIGSKSFTEQIILAELLAQHIHNRTGLDIDRRLNLGGALICQKALTSGEIDLYVEYTGTALTVILGDRPSTNPADVLGRVRAGYASRFDLQVADPLGFNNTFAIVVRGDDARRLKLKKISDIGPYFAQWRAGFGYEFMERPDGFAGLAATYHLRLVEPPRSMELGLLYRALKEKQVDVVAGNSTDGVIAALDLVVLEDDRHYFPPYEAVPIVRREALEQHPALRAALHELAGKISDEEMRRLNYAVDGEHRPVKPLVQQFRQAKGL